jgi:three-Cys-motif partner protein
MANVQLDEIDYWSEVKLDIVKKYASAYSIIMNKQSSIRDYYYIDGFAGAGIHFSKSTQELVPGSPSNALSIIPPFNGYHFIDLDGVKTKLLEELSRDNPKVKVYKGDCNKVLLEEIFPNVRYDNRMRALCLLDPYNLNPNWEVIETAGRMKSIEIFINFMIMDANMNIFWNNPEKVFPEQIERMNSFWGDESWRQECYSAQPGLFEDIAKKNSNKKISASYQKRLKEIAGFEFVPDPMPMRNSKGAIIYYLFFASHNKIGGKIVKQIFNKYRDRGNV